MATNDPEYDIHPLDRDYSSPPPARVARELSMEEKIRRFGLITFAVGFVLVLFAAILLGAFSGTGWIESFGSVTHRFAMFVILVGGLMTIVSYRIPVFQKSKPVANRKTHRAPMGTLGMLLVCNVVFLVLVVGLAGLSTWGRSTFFLQAVINGMFSIIFAMMVIMIIWHRGMLRAFAIGVMVAMLLNGLTLLFNINTRYSSRSTGPLMLSHLVTIQVTGLVCAGYVAFVAANPDDKETDPRKSPDSA